MSVIVKGGGRGATSENVADAIITINEPIE